MYTHQYIHPTHPCIYTYPHIHKYMYTYPYVYIHPYIEKYIYTHIYIWAGLSSILGRG